MTLVLADRLRRAREAVGLSQAAAADAASVNRVQLSYYESGRRQIPLTTAALLARLYGTSLDALLSDERPAEPAFDVSGVLFRASPSALGDAALAGLRLFERYVTAFVELSRDVGVDIAAPRHSPLAPPKGHSRAYASAAARKARDVLGLGQGALDDPFLQVDDLALVWRLPLGRDLDRSPSGFFYNHPHAGFCVVVNSDMTLGRQVFTLAHELAHAFFDSSDADVIVSTRSDRASTRERFANSFAGEFLVPGDGLRTAVSELGKWDDLRDPALAVHLQRDFGVSYATLLVRLRQERLIDQQTYNELRAVSPSRLARALGYQVHPADLGEFDMHPLERFPARMLLLVRLALQSGTITLGDAAETLGASREHVRGLVDRHPLDESERLVQEDLEDAAAL